MIPTNFQPYYQMNKIEKKNPNQYFSPYLHQKVENNKPNQISTLPQKKDENKNSNQFSPLVAKEKS